MIKQIGRKKQKQNKNTYQTEIIFYLKGWEDRSPEFIAEIFVSGFSSLKLVHWEFMLAFVSTSALN